MSFMFTSRVKYEQLNAMVQANFISSRSAVDDVSYRPLNDYIADGGDVTEHHRHVPPPPPPPRGGLFWRQQQQQARHNMASDQDFALSHSALHDHVTEQPSVNDRRLVSENGDVTLRRNGASQGQLDDRVYHIADGHTTVRPHLEVIV